MRSFDAGGTTWEIELDGLILGDVLEATSIDLATAAGWATIETNVRERCRVLVALCREQWSKTLTDRKFAKLLKGTVLSEALQAVQEAAQAFFPPDVWSKIQSDCKQRKAEGVLTESPEMLDAFLKLSPEVQQVILESQTADTALSRLEGLNSATGPENTPSAPASDSAESLESAPANA